MLEKLKFHPHPWVDTMIKAVLAAGLMASIGRLEIGTDTGVNITLQTLLVLLPAAWFGPVTGVLAVAVYMTMGICGLQVFPGEETGIGKLLGPTGGFYFGFLIAAGLVGYLLRMPKVQGFLGQLAVWMFGHLIILLFGFWWLWSVSWVPAETANFDHLKEALFPLFPGLLVKSAIGVMLTTLIHRLLLRRAKR